MGSTSTQYEALAEQIESFLQDPSAQIQDEQARRRLAAAACKLGVALESPMETLRRFGYAHLQLPMAMIGVETGLFAALAAEPRSFTSTELADKTAVNFNLLNRLLRYYTAVNIVSQNGDTSYQASNVTRALSDDYRANSLRFSHRITAPGSLNLPDWLQSHGFKDPVGIMPTAWATAINTDKHGYEWLAENPWALKIAHAHMSVQRRGRPVCFDAFDFQKSFGMDTTDSTILFVDIGGATGAQAVTFRQRYPELPGRVILQDRPEMVERAKAAIDSSFNVEIEEYDIFTPEVVKGARAYYLRNILHAWPDAQNVDILVNIKSGMAESSVILIDETVLPERVIETRGPQQDMEMMTCLAGIERTEARWEGILKNAGLKLHTIIRYDEEFDDCLIVAGLQ